MKINGNIRSRLLAGASTAFIATLAASPAFAQATSDLAVGTAPSTAADLNRTLVQDLTGTVAGSQTGTTVDLVMTDGAAGADITYDGSYTASDNLFSSAATGNLSDGQVIFTFDPTTSGDTAVSAAYQTNTAGGADVTATATNVINNVDISESDAGFEAGLTGTLLVDNNDVTTSAASNNASSSITLASGNITEAAATQASVAIDDSLASATDSANQADQLVTNLQSTAGATSIQSIITNADVDVDVETVSGATLTVQESDIGASAAGNVSSGTIASTDTAATITAAMAVSNLQNLDLDAGDGVAASVTFSDIHVNVGEELNGGLESGSVDSSTIAIASNDVSAIAEGNDSTQSISLQANAITGGAAATSADSAPASSGVQLALTGDMAVGNVQVQAAGNTTAASLASNNVVLEAVDVDGTIGNNTLKVTNNELSATARGSDAASSLSLQAGSRLSASGVVGNVQTDGGATVTATTSNTAVTLLADEGDTAADDLVSGSTLAASGNNIAAAATGARANNDLLVASGTNNLEVAANGGTVAINGDPTAEAIAPSATAGYVITNEQAKTAGSVTSTINGNATILTSVGSLSGFVDLTDSTVHTGGYVDASGVLQPGNSLSASATGATADNLLSLNFNSLTGAATTAGDQIAATANNQTLGGTATITARAVDEAGGEPITATFQDDVTNSTITTSYNTVSAVARGNQTTNNDVVVNATNVVIDGGIDAAPTIGLTDGDLTAAAAFTSASVQEIDGATITATQLDVAGAVSNTIDTEVNGLIGSGATIVSAENALSVFAVGNEAANAVTLGSPSASTIQASSLVANAQTIEGGAIEGLIGVTGADGTAAYNSSNSAAPVGGQVINSLGGGQYTNNGSTFTLTFAEPLTATEQQLLLDAGFSNVTANSADFGAGQTVNVSSRMGVTFTDPADGEGSGDEIFGILNFNASALPPSLNNAGVTITRADTVTGSTLAVTGNTVAGEVRGNVASNATSLEATTITATNALAEVVVDPEGADVSPDNALTAVANFQDVDAATTLDMDASATFAILDDVGAKTGISSSSQAVDDNLVQSYATANLATNAVSLSATNSSGDAGLENRQRLAGDVGTTSDIDVMATFGMASSTTTADRNVNQSVANGNVETSTLLVDATNVTAADGSVADASIDKTASAVSTGDAVAGTRQMFNGLASVDARATTDVFNEDAVASAANIDNIEDSTASMSDNATLAQATANNSNVAVRLGSPTAANYDASASLASTQAMAAGSSVNAQTDTEISLTLTDDDAAVTSSTVNLDGNTASALARGNVGSNTLSAAATNVAAGTVATDATVNGQGGTNTGAFLLSAEQIADSQITADSSSTSVTLDLSGSGVAAGESSLLNSTATLNDNVSSATAVGNTGTNSVALGLAGSTSNLASTGGLTSYQLREQAATSATGGMTILADIDSATSGVDTIDGSVLKLDGNASSATATGNKVANAVSAIAANVTSGASTDAQATAASTVANGGNVLHNEQSQAAAVTALNTANSITVDLDATDMALTASTVSLSDNSVDATSEGNTATNSIALGRAGTTTLLDSTGALLNSQRSTVGVSSTAGVTVSAGLASTAATEDAVDGSTLVIAGNSSTARSTANQATNTYTAAGASLIGGDVGTDATSTAAGVSNAGNVVLNRQDSTGGASATSTANTFSAVLDSADNTVNASTVDLLGNEVAAYATGNLSGNTMSLGTGATADISTSGTVNNFQTTATGAILATASNSQVLADVDSSTVGSDAISASTVSIADNSTVAMGRGNVAQNVLNVSGAQATGGTGGNASVVPGTASATYAVLNNQTSASAVTAEADTIGYSLALNGAAPAATDGALNSTLSVTGNTANALAYGNVATNALKLTALNGSTGDATAAVANVQANSAAIAARSTTVTFGFTADGAVAGSTARVGGNTSAATAVGNYATSIITRN